ncbi:hypothetical protein PENTCL1PPCAC_17504, partial [Pristionchus entomophagus]
LCQAMASSSQLSSGSNRLARNPSAPSLSSSNSRPSNSSSSQPNVPNLVSLMSANRLANVRRDSAVEEMHLVNGGAAREEEEDRVDIEDIRDIVREDPLDLPSLLDWNDWDQNGDSDSEWARLAAQNGNRRGRGNEGGVRRGSLNRSRELQNNQGGSSSTWNRRSSLSHLFPSSSSSLSSITGIMPFVAPRNMQALNEDGSLTEYGESLIGGYSGMNTNPTSNTVRNINAHTGEMRNEESDGREEEEEERPESSSGGSTMAKSERERLASALQGSAVRNAAELVGVGDVLAFGRRTSPAERRRRNEARAAANALDPMGWQASKSTLKERISFMYCNDILADVYFVVGKEESRQRIPAHKFVLSIGSVVFDAMFNGGLAPNGESANSNDPVEIELPDVEPSSFLSLLRFLYSDDVSIGPDTVMTTLYTAKKYAVPALETACVDFLKQSLGADNAFMLLTQARLFDEQQLAQLCLDLIDKHTPEAFAAEGFTDVDLSTLSAVLTRDTLRIREMPLFQAVCRWAESECERKGVGLSGETLREALGGALPLIRFPLMTPEEFANGPAQSGILSDTECKALFLNFHAHPKPSIPFSDRPRCAIDGPEMVISRFQRIDARWGYNGMPDRIKFTVDRKIYVTGFGLHGSVNGPYEYACTIQILHCGTGKVLAHHDTSFTCDGSTATFKVSFREPVEIMNGVTYIASACIKGGDSHYGTKGLRRVVHPSGSPTFQFTYAAGNNNGTSVEDGQIPEIYFYTKTN